MSLVFCHGMDDGIHVGATGHYEQVGTFAPSLVSGGRNGNQLRMTQNGAQTGIAKKVLDPSDAHATMIVGIYLKAPGYYGEYPQLLTVYGDAGATEHIRALTSGGSLLIKRGGAAGTTLLTIPSFIAAWPNAENMYIEMKVVLHDTTGSVVVRKNGVVAGSVTDVDTKNGGTNPTLDAFAFGCHNNGPNSTDFEDLYVCNGAGSTNNDFLGDIRVITALPNAAGTFSQLSGSDGNSVDNHLLVDEATPSNADYVTGDLTGETDTYGFAALGVAGTVLGVAVTAQAVRVGAGDVKLKAVAYANGDLSESASKAVAGASKPITAVIEKNPDTNAAWTVAEVDAAEFGVRFAQ